MDHIASRLRHSTRSGAMAALLLATLACACGQPTPASTAPAGAVASDETHPSAASLATAEPSVASSLGPARTERLAPTSSSAPSSTPSASGTIAPLLPLVSTSPGKIECGTVECDSTTELCCETFSDQGRCVAKTEKAGCGSVDVKWKECDEVGDCGGGERCCYAPRPDPTVAAQNVCRKGMCEEPEIETCLPGGKCASGRKCKASPGQREGYCPR